MISAETTAELEARRLLCILGVRERTDWCAAQIAIPAQLLIDKSHCGRWPRHGREPRWNICTGCADERNQARRSKNISKVAALVNRSNRFPHAVPFAEALGRSPSDDAARPENSRSVAALGAASRQRRAEHRNRRLPIHPCHCRGHSDPPNQSAIHQSH